MGTRTRLFAGAAFPLLSLSLILQPAHAAMLQSSGMDAGAKQSAGQTSFEVAQAAAEPAQDEQDPRKKKKPEGQEQGQPPKKEQPAAAPEAPKPPKAAEPEAPKPPKAAEPEAPKPPKAAEPEAPKPPKAAEPEAPKPPKAAEPEAVKPPKAVAPAAPAAAEPEAPKPPKPDKKAPAAEPAKESAAPKPAAESTAPAAEPEAQPQGNKHHKPKDQAQPEAAPDAAQPADPAAQPEAAPGQPQKHHQKPANGAAQPAEPPAPVEAPAKPKAAAPAAEAPAQPAAPAAPNAQVPVTAKPEGEKPPVNAEGQQKPAPKGEQPATPGAQQTPVAPGEKPAPATPGEKPATEQPATPANGKPASAEAPAAPAQNGAAVPQTAPSTAGEQVSPAELERRKKIADNPAAAGNGAGPVILPVQNGTAVLDSDKDAARHGHHGKPGDGQPAPGGQAPAGQVQPAAGDQRPPAPENVRAPTSDADSQLVPGGKQAPPIKIEAVTSERGQRMDRRPDFAAPDGAQIGDRQDNRVIINFGDDVFVRHDDTQRFTRDGERPSYEQLPRDRYRETIGRPDGTQIVTVRNRYGDIIQRSRVDQDGREYVLFYSPELENTPDQDDYYRDPGDQLPPMRLRIPLNQYIIDTSEDQNQDYYDFLRKPPVEPVERVYSLNEVRYSARIRDKVRRIDLDTITFATGSADIPMVQAKTLRGIADGIGKIIKKDPSETFLIEGHTDAVGSDQSNLILSDQRAESVANVLTDVYGIPPENLATQGYGEQYLKINTDGPEQENRRVTIRRVTALVRPVAAK